MKSSLNWTGQLMATLASVALLVACGGGGGGAEGGIGSGGTGQTTPTPAQGLAVGTVGGFGSIYVGGVRCDDTRAKVSFNTSTGAPDTGSADVKLGQHVQIVFDATSATCKIVTALVDPDVVGKVSSLSPLTVAGQRIVINNDASTAPATVFEGYADASAIKVGDRVEVHGDRITVAGAPALQATRIERKLSTDTWVRVKGVVAGLATAQFTLGGLTVKRSADTKLDPSSLTLANGQTVVVWSTAPVALDSSVTPGIIKLARSPLEAQQAVRVEGVVTGCSAAPCTQPTVDGLVVDLGGATFSSGSAVDVVNGAAMRVEGTFDSARSVLVASKASVRARDVTAGEVNLIGVVSDFVSTTDFSVRGVPVTTNASTVVAAGCTVAAGQIVGIKGMMAQSQVLATRVDCLTLTDGLTLDIFGALLNVDATAKTFNLSEGAYKAYTLTWDADTVFSSGLSGATLTNGLRVGLRAVLVDGKLLVKRMVADPTPTAPPGVQLLGNFGIAQDVTAGSITVKRFQMAVTSSTEMTGTIVDGTPVRVWFYRTTPLAPWQALKVAAVSWN